MKKHKLCIVLLFLCFSCSQSIKLKKAQKKLQKKVEVQLLSSHPKIDYKYFNKDICGYGYGNHSILLPFEFEEKIANKLWVIDSVFGLNESQEHYQLTKKDTSNIKWSGNYFIISDNSCFTSGYGSWCENEFITTVNGKYKLIMPNRLELKIDSIFYKGEIKKPTEYRTGTKIFTISNFSDTILINKVK